MKFLISLILMALLSFAACLYMEWWSIAIVCFLVSAIINQKPGIAFLTGFLALLLLWGGMSFWISNINDHLLAHRLSPILVFKDSPGLLIFATGLTGALVGGLAALTGAFTRPALKPRAA